MNTMVPLFNILLYISCATAPTDSFPVGLQKLNPKFSDFFSSKSISGSELPVKKVEKRRVATVKNPKTAQGNSQWEFDSGLSVSRLSAGRRKGPLSTVACGDLSSYDVAVGVLSRHAGANSGGRQTGRRVGDRLASKHDVLWEEQISDETAMAGSKPTNSGTSGEMSSRLQQQQRPRRPLLAVQRFSLINRMPPRPSPPPAPPIPQPRSVSQVRAVRDTWLQYFPFAAVFWKQQGSAPLDLALMLLHLRRMYPNKKWYLLAHDDTYIFPVNLLCELRANSPTQPWYVGSTHCQGPNFRCQHLNIKYENAKTSQNFGGWNNGGAGVALSAAMLDRIDLRRCLSYYNQRWKFSRISGADVVLGCCVADHQGKRVHVKGFTAGPPGFGECQCQTERNEIPSGRKPSCSLDPRDSSWKRISYHAVNATTMRVLHAQHTQEPSEPGPLTSSTFYQGAAKFPIEHAPDVWLYPSAVREATKPLLHGVKSQDWVIGEDVLKMLLKKGTHADEVSVGDGAIGRADSNQYNEDVGNSLHNDDLLT